MPYCAFSSQKTLISKAIPQRECENLYNIIFTLQYKHYLQLPALRNTYHSPMSPVGSYPSETATASQNLLPTEAMPVGFFAQSSNSRYAQPRLSWLVFQTSNLGNPCLHKIIYLKSKLPNYKYMASKVFFHNPVTVTLKYKSMFCFL